MNSDPTGPTSDSAAIASAVDISPELTRKVSIASNIDHDVIVVSREKAKNVLLENLPRYAPREQMLAAWALFAGLIVPLLSSEFRDFGIPAESWATVVAIGCFLSLAWAVHLTIKHIRSVTADDLLNMIANQGSDEGGRPR